MFTGLIEACVPVRALERRGTGARLVLPRPSRDFVIGHGESLAVSGCCLTVVAGGGTEESGAPGTPGKFGQSGADLEFDLSSETLAKTWFDELAPGRIVNLERALKLDERLGGHLVSGHVDAVGRLVAVEETGDGGRRIEVEVPAGFERYLIEKGSVTLDGISLTVVAPQGRRFSVALIPETLAKTNLGVAKVGERLNLEADLVGKWIERLVAPQLAR
ncbi:MAG: riboflavin synthase [Planctomycetes bacterium]|nr:riboflavin synthase [Planctomycetota bacterium]